MDTEIVNFNLHAQLFAGWHVHFMLHGNASRRREMVSKGTNCAHIVSFTIERLKTIERQIDS